MKTDLVQSCGHCWVFQICWHIEWSTFTASSFRIWNSSTGISSPPLALFIVMLSKGKSTTLHKIYILTKINKIKRILVWAVMPSSRESFRTRDWIHISYVSCIGRWVLYHQHHLGSPLLGLYSPQIKNTNLIIYMFPNVYKSTVYNSQVMETIYYKCLSTDEWIKRGYIYTYMLNSRKVISPFPAILGSHTQSCLLLSLPWGNHKFSPISMERKTEIT